MARWRLVSIAIMMIAVGSALSAQARRVTPPQEVPSLDELRPKTPEQIARAEFFVISEFWREVLGPKPLVEARTFVLAPIFHPGPPRPPRTPEQVLEDQICRSTVVIVGQAMSSEAFLTKDGIALFTDFPVRVNRWVRGQSDDRDILVTMPGGRAVVGGSLALSASFDYFMETQQSYVMYLRWSERVRAYLHVARPVPAAGGKVIHAESVFPSLQIEDEELYLARLSSAAMQCGGR
jgi:hypothetical protein